MFLKIKISTPKHEFYGKMTLKHHFKHTKGGFLSKNSNSKKSFPRGCVDRVGGGLNIPVQRLYEYFLNRRTFLYKKFSDELFVYVYQY